MLRQFIRFLIIFLFFLNPLFVLIIFPCSYLILSFASKVFSALINIFIKDCYLFFLRISLNKIRNFRRLNSTETKYKALIIIACVLTGGLIAGISIWFGVRQKQKMDRFFTYMLIGMIPAQFSLEVESDTDWSGIYMMGTGVGMPSSSGNKIYSGTGTTATAMFYMTSAGTLTIRLKVNGVTMCQRTTTSTFVYLQCSATSPTYIFTYLALLEMLS